MPSPFGQGGLPKLRHNPRDAEEAGILMATGPMPAMDTAARSAGGTRIIRYSRH